HRLPRPDVRMKPDLAGPSDVPLHFAGAGAKLLTGTSSAAAFLAGSATLLRSAAPSDGYWASILQMRNKAIDVGKPGWDSATGYGLDPSGNNGPGIPLNGNSWTLIGPSPETNGQIAGK